MTAIFQNGFQDGGYRTSYIIIYTSFNVKLLVILSINANFHAVNLLNTK